MNRLRLPKFRNIILSKRQLFVVITLLLTAGVLGQHFLSLRYSYLGVGLLGLLSLVLSWYCLREDMSGIKHLTLLILPTLFTLAVGYFYYLVPVRLITRLPFALFYALGFYAILLTENIFNVASGRTIQLIRAAQAVGFYLTLITVFLLYDLTFSLHLYFWANGFLVFIFSFLLILPSLWYITLEDRIGKSVWYFTFLLSLVLAEFALAFSFWPVLTLTEAIFLTGVFYTLLGISQYYLAEKLFRRATLEFLLVAGIIFILTLLTTSWVNF
ncbi:MAG: hypothetical protein M1120_01220 [Patescibacteria group bacterium]|nr:hypothetical protein [Patescibacteria group bacterium]